MKTYRLVYRASHRETNSRFTNPRFRLQLPETVLNNGTNKKCEIILEHFSGYIAKNANALDDAVVVKIMRPAINSVQTNGVNKFENGNTLGIATMLHSHTNENFVSLPYSTFHGLEHSTGIFNQNFLDFALEHIDGTSVGIPATANFREYTIILSIKIEE